MDRGRDGSMEEHMNPDSRDTDTGTGVEKEETPGHRTQKQNSPHRINGEQRNDPGTTP